MNPRILKKLSKRVVALGIYAPKELYKQLDSRDTSEYRPSGASKKLSHREREWWRKEKPHRHPMGDMFTIRGTYWVCWTSGGFDGDEHDSAVAWELAERTVRGEIAAEAEDWENFDPEGGDQWPKWKGGKPPKYPRSTPAMLRAIERHASEQVRQREERRQRMLAARSAA